jgi:CheY-like chemotaxis protein
MLRELGHSVAEAAGGGDALKQLRAGLTVDAVISDYMMPDMNGGALAEAIRKLKPGMPVLIVTGYAGGELNLEMPQLAKPFRQTDLAAALERLVAGDTNVVRLRPAGR